MRSKWKNLPLEEAMDAIIDYRGKTPKKTERGIPLITAKIVKNGRIKPTQEYIAEADYDSWMQRGIPQKGDIVLTTEAPLGEVAQLNGDKIALAQRIITLRGKSGLLESDFLKYLLQSNDVQHQLDGRASGTTVSGIKQSELRKIILNFPPLSDQKAIAHILGSLDDKIELNRRMNATLEGMAQALFKSWFVDFGPVIDNTIVAGNPIPDELTERAEIRSKALADGSANREAAKSFPTAFQFTEKMGWIPEGWEVATLGDYLEVKRGGSPRPIHDFLRPKGLPWVKIADATASTSRFLFTTKAFIKPEGLRKTVLMKKGSLILSNSATPGLPIFLELDACIHDGWLHFPKKRYFGDLYFYQLFLVIREELVNQGSGSVFTNLKTDILRAQRIVVPPSPLLKEFEGWMKPNFEKILSLNIEIRTLTNLRDTLLPKLISGEIRIPDAEKYIKETIA